MVDSIPLQADANVAGPADASLASRGGSRPMRRLLVACALVAPWLATYSVRGEEGAWRWLLAPDASTLAAWSPETAGWTLAGDASLRPAPDGALAPHAGQGVLIGRGGLDCADLVTLDEFRDLQVELEFMIGRGSNSGVKLNGLYEIQLRDTAGEDVTTGDMCGGVYPRAEQGPPYRTLDDGVPPRTNAARAAGEWQKLALAFRSPRFDGEGNKTQDARLEWVRLNGVEIHRDVTLATPTGAAWRLSPETPQGPLLLQGTHGPVAFRAVRVRPLPPLRGK